VGPIPSHLPTMVLAAAANPADLRAARTQMAVSLGWRIIIACLGVGFPLLVLFAVGAVSGTILSFELGILWPGLIGTYGEVMGLPFAIEGVWFFTEAIFLGIYLYARDRLRRRRTC
jgi:cytochrome bd ubiquinol oxidase subunit I